MGIQGKATSFERYICLTQEIKNLSETLREMRNPMAAIGPAKEALGEIAEALLHLENYLVEVGQANFERENRIARLETFMQSIGDSGARFDRLEEAMNEVLGSADHG